MADLNRLEGIIGTIMRAGVALSAVMMVGGLAMVALGLPQAGAVLSWGLIALMMIPSARILVSLVDALLRRDWLLVVATVIVCVIIAEEVFRKIFQST
jgi:uncharacterized membrane protein